MVETDGLAGFRRGRLLDKVGQQTVDTAELFFDDMRVPVSETTASPVSLTWPCWLMVCKLMRARRSPAASNNSVTWPEQVIWSPTWVIATKRTP